jgi:ABC-2 type transport system permease protein
MNRLLRVELRRYRSRRVTLWVSIGLLVVVALSTLAAATTARPPGAAELAQAQQAYEQTRTDWDENGEQYVADCRSQEESDADPDADYGCDQMEPTLEQFLPPSQDFFPGRARSDAATSGFGVPQDGTKDAAAIARLQGSVWSSDSGLGELDVLAPVLLFAVFLVAVSFVTAELTSGAIGLWLTFVPGRTRVYWSKASAAAIWAVSLAVVGFALLVAGAWGAYAVFGDVGEAPEGVVAEIAAFTGRLALAAAAVALAGVALGLLLRHSAAAIGIAAAWVGVESLFRLAAGDVQRWMLSVNLSAWLNGGTVYWTEHCAPDESGMVTCTSIETFVSPHQGGLVVLGVTVVLALVAFLVFRRRDVA